MYSCNLIQDGAQKAFAGNKAVKKNFLLRHILRVRGRYHSKLITESVNANYLIDLCKTLV